MYWIDGTPIYRKIITYNGSLKDNSYDMIGFINNVSIPIRAYGFSEYITDNSIRAIPHICPNEPEVNVGISFSNSGNIVSSSGKYGSRFRNLTIIAEYTKVSNN